MSQPIKETNEGFWDQLKKDFSWDSFGGICLGCNQFRVNDKTVEFFRLNKLPLGSCMYCLEKSYTTGNRKVINPINHAFPAGGSRDGY